MIPIKFPNGKVCSLYPSFCKCISLSLFSSQGYQICNYETLNVLLFIKLNQSTQLQVRHQLLLTTLSSKLFGSHHISRMDSFLLLGLFLWCNYERKLQVLNMFFLHSPQLCLTYTLYFFFIITNYKQVSIEGN